MSPVLSAGLAGMVGVGTLTGGLGQLGTEGSKSGSAALKTPQYSRNTIIPTVTELLPKGAEEGKEMEVLVF